MFSVNLLLFGAIMMEVRHCYCRMQPNVGGVAEAQKIVERVKHREQTEFPDV